MKKIHFFTLLLLMSFSFAQAQRVAVTGKVVSEDDNSAVVGAAIVVDGTSIGTVTNQNGEFSISVPNAASTLIVSYIGMLTQEVAAKPKMTIVLKSDAHEISSVVVTAMGLTRDEKSLGYSATAVSGDEISAKRTNDMMTGLAGKVAGVSISSTSSDPGASTSVVIRGVSSLSGSNQPLYVVDGVPMNNSAVYSSDGLNSGYDFGNGAAAIDPDNVESMTILKGAAATALYGSRAAGGVIIVTTKKGQKNNGIGVEYNGGVQLSSVLRLPQMQNEFGMGWYGDKTDIENGSWGPVFDGTEQIWGNIYDNSQKLKPYSAFEDNTLDFFETGVRYNNSISFNGATDQSDYYVSFSQVSDDGMIPTDADTYQKYTFTANGSHTIGDLKVSTAINYANQSNSYATTGQGLSMYNSILQTPRDISIIGLEDQSDPFNTPGYYYTPYGVANPYYILENYMNEYNSERIYGKFQVDYSITDAIKLSYRFGLDSSTGETRMGEPNLYAMYYEGTPNGEGQGTGSPFVGETGSYTTQMTRRHEYNHDIMATYSADLTSELNLNAVVGFNGNERSANYLYSSIVDLTIPTWYNLSNSSSPATTVTYESLRRLMGVYAQVDLGWRNMLYFTATARNDWSSTLPQGSNDFFYPGVTASFVFSELLPSQTKDIISFGKVRAAWGKTGNDADVYMTNPYYLQSTAYGYWGDYAFPFSSSGYNAYTVGNVLGSATLSPEMTTEFEFGLNLALFNNRINIDAAYYDRTTNNQIYSLTMDPASGYSAQNTNLGEVSNKGVELLLNVVPVRTDDFTWEVGVNYTKNNSLVVSLPEEMGGETVIYGLSGGIGMYAIEGYPVGTFKAQVPQTTEDGQIVCNASTGLPVGAEDQAIVGDMNYDYQLGFNTSLTFKGITLAADFDYRKGGLMYSRTKDITYFTGNAIQTAYNDRNPFVVPNSVNAVTAADGTVTYVENTTPLDNTNIYTYWDAGGSEMDSGFLVDKTYLKLRSLSLSWNLPQSWLASTPLTAARISAFGNNLFIWTPDTNTFMDPDSSSFGNDLEGNYGEWTANPSSRYYGFNLMVKF
ncbi:MAG: SusC/RagA family TonB-linked outer membrane protein [Rikenellaceae bacterium]